MAETLEVILAIRSAVLERNDVIEFARGDCLPELQAFDAERVSAEDSSATFIGPFATPARRLLWLWHGDEGKGTPTPLDGEHSASSAG